MSSIRLNERLFKSLRLGRHIGVKGCIFDIAAPRPEADTADLVRIGFSGDWVSARPLRGAGGSSGSAIQAGAFCAETIETMTAANAATTRKTPMRSTVFILVIIVVLRLAVAARITRLSDYPIIQYKILAEDGPQPRNEAADPFGDRCLLERAVRHAEITAVGQAERGGGNHRDFVFANQPFGHAHEVLRIMSALRVLRARPVPLPTDAFDDVHDHQLGVVRLGERRPPWQQPPSPER